MFLWFLVHVSCIWLADWSVSVNLAWQKFNIGHCNPAFQPASFISTMLKGTMDFYYFIPPSVALTLAGGHLLASFSLTLFSWSEWVSVSEVAIVALGKSHCTPSCRQQSPQGCPCNSANLCLVEHRSHPTLECGMLAASFLPLSFRQLVLLCFGLSMFWKFLKPISTSALSNCRPDLMSAVLASLYAHSFPLTGIVRTVDLLKSVEPKTVLSYVQDGAAHPRLHFLQQVH